MNRTVKGMVAIGMSAMLLLSGGGLIHTQSQLEEATKTVNRLEQKVNENHTNLNSLQTVNNVLLSETEKMKKSIDSLKEENKRLKESNKELREVHYELKNTNGRLKRELQRKAEAKKKAILVKKEVKTVAVASASTKPMPSRGSVSATSGKASYRIVATAYTAYCSTGCIGITATGKDVSNTIYHDGMRIIAVDPNIIPLHSIVLVRLGDGTMFKAIALDTGGDIKGYRLDLLVSDTNTALDFGRQEVTVTVL